MRPLFLAALLAPLLSVQAAQPGSPNEPVRLVNAGIDLQVHDGRLRPAIGVENIQVMRANRTHPDLADGFNNSPDWWSASPRHITMSELYGARLNFGVSGRF
jgi:hypothetical protein